MENLNWCAANAEVIQAGVCHLLQCVQVAPVQNDGIIQELLNARQIQSCEFFPFGQNQQSIGPVSRCVGIGRVSDAFTQQCPGLLHSCGIKRGDEATFLYQRLYDSNRRGLANIVSSALESQTQHREALVLESPQSSPDFLQKSLELLLVNFAHLF